MPYLVKDDAREKACAEVEALLAEVKELNLRIISKDPFRITGTGKKAPQVILDEDLTEQLIKALETQRKRRIRDVKQKVRKYNVGLSDEESAMLAEAAIAGKSSTISCGIEKTESGLPMPAESKGAGTETAGTIISGDAI